MPPDHEDMLPAKRLSMGEVTVHGLVVVLAVLFLYFGFFIAAMAGGAPEVLLVTLLPPLAGAYIAIVDRHRVVLATHGSVVVVNLLLVLVVPHIRIGW